MSLKETSRCWVPCERSGKRDRIEEEKRRKDRRGKQKDTRVALARSHVTEGDVEVLGDEVVEEELAVTEVAQEGVEVLVVAWLEFYCY